MKPSKNLLIILAASAILLMASAYYMSTVNRAGTQSDGEFREIEAQSSSDDTESIEDDLDETAFEDLDKELLDIEAELNSTTEAETK